ncbi:ABC transporter ATP-binding protein [Martelella sp. HB161492]|uniref:ABC transporter ATP-binding protein n=1 Tax=Martelella sp. HB161492 TaxID=2720726 RepID=UPI0015903C5C|nr:ABC transporter ATP-binding protein [Martelella sp. HB161492]
MAEKHAPDHLVISKVMKNYGGAEPALKSVSLSVRKGEFLALLGPSGCGKTTLLKIIAGLEKATQGTMALAGAGLDAIPTFKRDIGIVFQSYALFPHMSVDANIRFGLDMRGIKGQEADDRVAEALDLVKLHGLSARMPNALSGGQQQRVALARALVIRPKLLLLDEPLSNLDAVLRKSVRVDIRELHERIGLTTVMVTHDQEEAMSMADRVAVMANGYVLQHDSPETIYEQPASAFVATFVGNPPAILLPVEKAQDGGLTLGGAAFAPSAALRRAVDAAPGRSLLLGLRSDRLSFADAADDGTVSGEVHSSEYIGGAWLVHVALGEHRLAVPSREKPPQFGAPAHIRIADAAPLLFDAKTGQKLEAA